MDFRNISAWSIRNPVPPIIVFLGLLAVGILSFMRMPVSLDPDIDLPFVIVQIAQPGAAPTELETQIAQKVEASMRNVEGVQEITSQVREGSAVIFAEFALGIPIDRAVTDVRDAVSNIRGDLPDGILEPQVMRATTSDNPLAFYSITGDDMTLEQLSWYVDNDVNKRLRALPGVGGIARTGGVTREIRVILDPTKMQSFGITAVQVNAQLRQRNLNTAGGRTEIAGSEQSVRVLGNAKTAFELGEAQIALGGGRAIKLTDIAEVRDLYGEQRSLATMNGKQVLSFEVQRVKGASDVEVFNVVDADLRKIEKDDPRIKFELLQTNVRYAKEQYSSSMISMIEGALLAIVVVFIFLRDWRATLISAVAIPLSAIPTFYFMERFGFSLNQISLLGLGLVAGVLVDDAIVEIENIVRHMRMGKSAYQASIDAADEIGLAVLATTMAIVAVFLPVAIMPGVTGAFFRNFGMTVVIAVLLSLFVARLITPMMAAYFLKSHGEAPHATGWMMDKYMSILHWSLRHRWVTVIMGAASLAATVGIATQLNFSMFPDIDIPESQIRVEMVPGTTLDQTRQMAAKIQTMVEGEKEIVKSAFAVIRPGSANIYLSLHEDKPISSLDFEEKWGPVLGQVSDARVNFMAQNQGGPPGSGRDIAVTLAGDDPKALDEAASTLVEGMKAMPELVAPRISGDLQRPEITITPKGNLAASLGITTAALSQTVRIATIGDIDQNSPKFSRADRQIPIRVTLSEEARRDISTLENLPVPTDRGGSVPLKQVADITFGAGPTTIQRTNLNRRISIGADLAANVVSSEANTKIDALPIMKNLPKGVIRVVTGQNKMQAELVSNFIGAIITGIGLVFAVLLLLYQRLMPPFVNMGSLLLAPLGAVMALWIVGMPISMPVLIGMLMLLGIVAKNSILVVDFALEEMERGVGKTEAILEAGHKRAQPIVMTTVAMVAGMVPTAFALSGDGAWRQPMGVTVIGGLIVSTILTLIIVPASFSLAIGIESRLGPWASYWFTNGGEDGQPRKAPQLIPAWVKKWFGRRGADRGSDGLVQPAE